MPNSRFLDLRSLRYKGYKIKYIENLFRLLKFYKMTFYYLKVVKFKNLEFGVLLFGAGTLITYTTTAF